MIIDLMKDLTDYLQSKGMPHTVFSNNRNKGYVMCNGLRVSIEQGYVIRTLKGNVMINTEPLLNPREAYNYLTIPDQSFTLQEKIKSVIESRNMLIINMKRMAFNPKVKYAWNSRKETIGRILDLMIEGVTTVDGATEQITQLIETFILQKKHRDMPVQWKEVYDTLTPKLPKSVVVPIPLKKDFMLGGKISVLDFIIFETLVSYPHYIHRALQIAKGQKVPVNHKDVRPFQSTEKKKSKPADWVSKIRSSAYRENVFDYCLGLISQGSNYRSLKTRNRSIWDQLAVLYHFPNVNKFNVELPEDFLIKLKAFEIVPV